MNKLIFIFAFLVGCSREASIRTTVKEATCGGGGSGACRVLTEDGRRITITGIVMPGDEVCYIKEGCFQGWTRLCSK